MMSYSMRSPQPSAAAFWSGPYPWLLSGLLGGISARAWLAAAEVTAESPFDALDSPARIVLLFVSLVLAGFGVLKRPASVPVLLSGSAVAFLAWLSMTPSALFQSSVPWFGFAWDSFRVLVFVLTLVGITATVLVALPTGVRRVAVSGLVVFHFLAMLSAVFSVPPAPMLATNYWAYVARPYLEFIYLNNAYHFYSPDPGPPNLLWFRLEYADGSYRWHKLPNKEDYPTLVNYQRRLSMTESVHQSKTSEPHVMLERQRRREAVGHRWPAHPTIPLAAQFREPNAYSRRMIQNYIRWVARNDPYQAEAGDVVKVRLYRVIHSIAEASQLVHGIHPLDLSMYLPYYQGEYLPDGTLYNPQDPLLYWLIPIVRKDDHLPWAPSSSESLTTIPTAEGRTYQVYDFLKLHAGDYQ